MGVGRRIRDWVDRPVVTTRAFKAFLATVVVLAFVVPLALVAVPYIDFFNDMAVQYKVKAQMAWKVVDGAPVPADFPAVDQSLPRGVHPYPFPLPDVADPVLRKKVENDLADEAGRALAAEGPDIAPPYVRPRPTMDMVRHGQALYATTCIVCHGTFAMGDGTVAQRGFPAPPSLLDPKARGFADGRIFHVITSGQNRVMPSYADRFTPGDRWAIVYYVRSLQAAFPVSKEAAP